MTLRIGQVNELAAARNEADKALARLEVGVVNGFFAQAFGGEQLQRAVAQPYIDRAHFSDHVGGNQAHNTVELGV